MIRKMRKDPSGFAEPRTNTERDLACRVGISDWFGRTIDFDPETRQVRDESRLVRTQRFNCRAGDVLVFAGDQLHGGAHSDVTRLSIEFRVSRMDGYGRPKDGITYKPF